MKGKFVGNYKIFAQGEDSKLFSSGIEYDRHSWHQLLGAQVYYVAEFLPFVLLDQPAHLTFYGTPIGTDKQLVPGIRDYARRLSIALASRQSDQAVSYGQRRFSDLFKEG